MARGRLISKSLGSSRKYHDLMFVGGELGEFCQVLFPLLVANTDDFGRFSGDAFTVKHVVFPTCPRPEPQFEQALMILAQVGLIERYEVEGDIYIQINKFDDHQRNLHKRNESRFPEFPANLRKVPQKSALTQNPESNSTQNPEPRTAHAKKPCASFELFWEAYPKKEAKKNALRTWEKLSPNDDVLAAILRALERQKRSTSWQSESGRYIPLPATWLNQERWQDETPEPGVVPREDPHVTAFLEWFPGEYQKRRNGADYLVKRGKHEGLVKEMLAATSLENLKIYAGIMLSDDCDEPWIVNSGRGIEILHGKFDWLADRYAQWKNKQGQAS